MAGKAIEKAMTERNFKMGLFAFYTLCGLFWSLVAIFFFAFISIVLEGFPSTSIIRIERAFAFGLLAVIFGTPVLLLFGIPLHIVLSSLRMTSLWYYVGGGLLGGVLTVLIFRPFGNDPIQSLVVQSLHMGGFGILASLVFWVFSVKKMARDRRLN
ncbi:MAG: hypothetical protein ACT6R9_14820 [Methylophilus sp.]|uniref:hypothetical protein n=1 Tax=Methylophilus sp. TaxID=29541 RepID=UPI004036ADC1